MVILVNDATRYISSIRCIGRASILSERVMLRGASELGTLPGDHFTALAAQTLHATTTTGTLSDSHQNVWFFVSLIFVSSFYLCIPVPPIIEPFSFQDGLAEGMRTRTVCGVSSGDSPLTLRWLKDGEPLPLLLGVNISSLDLYSSLLRIPSLSASHSGEYTCVAHNPAAEIKYTATLQVKGTVCVVEFSLSIYLSLPNLFSL